MDFKALASFIRICDSKQQILEAIEGAQDGGPGSGNWGHKGRPTKRGGSSKRGSGGGSETLKRQSTAAAKLADNEKFKSSVKRALSRLPSGTTICAGKQDDGGWTYRKGDDGLWRFPDSNDGMTDEQLSRSVSFDDEDSFYRAATAKQAEKYDKDHEQFTKPKQEKPKEEKPKQPKKGRTPRQKSPFKKHKVSQGVYRYQMEDGRDFECRDNGRIVKSKYDDYISAVYYETEGWVAFKKDPSSSWQDEIPIGMKGAKIGDVLSKIAQISQADGVGAGKARLSNGKIYKHSYEKKYAFHNGTQLGIYKHAQADIYETEEGIHVSVMRNMDTKKQRMDIGKFMDVLQKTPTKLKQKGQKNIDIVDYENPRDSYWRKKYKYFSKSYATGGVDRITFYGTGTFHDYEGHLAGTVCHEMGHGLDKNNGNISATKQWTDAMQSDKIVSGMEHVSTYGSNAEKEDFADSVKMFARQPMKLKRNFPARYKIIQKYIGG